MQPLNFHVAAIADSLHSKKIGTLYAANQQLNIPAFLDSNADSYFSKLFRTSYYPKKVADSIAILIKNVTLTEKKVGGIVEGKCEIEISYHTTDNQFLLTKETSSAYKRTFGSATPRVFQQVVSQAFTRNIDYFNLWFQQNLAYHPALTTKSEIIIKPAYQQNVPDTVYYGSRPISWDDFTGKPVNRGSRFAAAIFPNIAFDLEMEVKNRTLRAFFTPKVYMVQGMSWVKSIALNDYSLEHEQLHFDIAKIAMNRMIKRISSIEAKTPDDLQSQIQYEYLEAYREMNQLQKTYDAETGHGINQLSQEFWKTQISLWLKE